jgi:hypothetical protein
MWLYDDPDSFTAVGRPGARERRESRGLDRFDVASVLGRMHDDDGQEVPAPWLPSAPPPARRRHETARRQPGRERTRPRRR